MVKFTAHCLVKNEDLWIWYALQSIINYAEEIIVYDTGSTDRTVEIIKTVNSPKIKLSLLGEQSRESLVELRNQQISKTQTPWFLILDGDEVWPEDQLCQVLTEAQEAPSDIKAIVSRTKICLGDVYHYLPDSGGQYKIAGLKGNFNIRLIRKSENLRVEGEYPLEAYCDEKGQIAMQSKNLKFSSAWYLHTSFLKRSSLDSLKHSGSLNKAKLWEKGKVLEQVCLPEVLRLNPPVKLSEPLKKRGLSYEILANISTPLINLKRFFINE